MSANVDARKLHGGSLAPPLSKSDAQRSLALAHALGRPELRSFMTEARPHALSEDVHVLAHALETLREGRFPADIDCKDGGAPFRLALTQAAITKDVDVSFHGGARLGERPHASLFAAIEDALGPAGLTFELGSPWPIRVRGEGRTSEPRFRVSGKESSQYASSLLLGAACLAFRERRTWTVELTSEVASRGYLAMTIDWMGRAGLVVEERAHEIHVSYSESARPSPKVPGDWSSLGYLLVAAWKTGSVVENVDESADHPDRTIIENLRAVGLTVETVNGGTRVTGVPKKGLVATAEECPDAILTLAALAMVLPAPSRFDDVAILRVKESDRLAGVEALVAAAGGTTKHEGDSLVVTPPSAPRKTLVVDTQRDHRMAMAATTLALLLEGSVELSQAKCVEKSFPDFFAQIRKAGVTVTSDEPLIV